MSNPSASSPLQARVTRQYLGDSVYVAFDGFNFILSLDNGEGAHSIIIMEPQVVASLLKYIKAIQTADE